MCPFSQRVAAPSIVLWLGSVPISTKSGSPGSYSDRVVCALFALSGRFDTRLGWVPSSALIRLGDPTSAETSHLNITKKTHPSVNHIKILGVVSYSWIIKSLTVWYCDLKEEVEANNLPPTLILSMCRYYTWLNPDTTYEELAIHHFWQNVFASLKILMFYNNYVGIPRYKRWPITRYIFQISMFMWSLHIPLFRVISWKLFLNSIFSSILF